MNGLGYSYANGRGVARDVAEGVRLLTKAANFGSPNAMHTLAVLNCGGGGCAQDLEAAYIWASLGVRIYGKTDPKLAVLRTQRAQISSALSSADRTRLDAQVAAWRPVEIAPAAAPLAMTRRPTSNEIDETV